MHLQSNVEFKIKLNPNGLFKKRLKRQKKVQYLMHQRHSRKFEDAGPTCHGIYTTVNYRNMPADSKYYNLNKFFFDHIDLALSHFLL